MGLFKKNTGPIQAKSIIKGKAQELKTIKDGVFSERMMGDGVVVRFPEETTFASVCAPISGTLVTVFPTGHAYGIKSKEGIEILIHIGVDTVNLGGKGFKPNVKQGDKVKVGEKLVDVDVAEIRKSNLMADPIVIVTSGQAVVNKAKGDASVGTTLFEVE